MNTAGEQFVQDYLMVMDTSPAALLVRQIMGGWGDTEFFAIAKQYYKQEEATA